MTDNSHVVVIGGGFSGVALAVQLLREDRAPVTVTIIEGRQALGQGLAYGTRDDGHLLNTTNTRSSAIEDDDSHFLRWLERSGKPAVAEGYSTRQAYSPACRSRCFEHTAIPELRRQAAELASLVTESRVGPWPGRPAHWMPASALTHVPQRPPWGRLNTQPRLLRNSGELLQ